MIVIMLIILGIGVTKMFLTWNKTIGDVLVQNLLRVDPDLS
jgi:hypothetical protein